MPKVLLHKLLKLVPVSAIHGLLVVETQDSVPLDKSQQRPDAANTNS